MSADPRVGTQIGGYRIERLLGRGGTSVVYVAEHVRMKRKAALRLPSTELAEGPIFRARFVSEWNDSRGSTTATEPRIRGGRGGRSPVHLHAVTDESPLPPAASAWRPRVGPLLDPPAGLTVALDDFGRRPFGADVPSGLRVSIHPTGRSAAW